MSPIAIFSMIIWLGRLVGLEWFPSCQPSPSPTCSTQISEAKDAFGFIQSSPLPVNTPIIKFSTAKTIFQHLTISSQPWHITGIIFIRPTKSQFIFTSQCFPDCSLFAEYYNLLHNRFHLYCERSARDKRKDRSRDFNAFPKGVFSPSSPSQHFTNYNIVNIISSIELFVSSNFPPILSTFSEGRQQPWEGKPSIPNLEISPQKAPRMINHLEIEPQKTATFDKWLWNVLQESSREVVKLWS